MDGSEKHANGHKERRKTCPINQLQPKKKRLWKQIMTQEPAPMKGSLVPQEEQQGEPLWKVAGDLLA